MYWPFVADLFCFLPI